ncbi:hypothetical protein ONZ51_g1672 [Trametes cubensis]|uniref:Uncharacterized protein n=1 Tax=Trametes cubensis TaxID=1111947 RepID=A0AAD7XCR1_9APHY|nr:hypothetical protein ONZ51_g1672 [Trametes cubensis]
MQFSTLVKLAIVVSNVGVALAASAVEARVAANPDGLISCSATDPCTIPGFTCVSIPFLGSFCLPGL